MKKQNKAFDLLLAGLGPRLGAVLVIIVLLWAGFFGVTGLPWAVEVGG